MSNNNCTIWTVKTALDWTEGYLSGKGDENPLLSAQWLLSDATGLSRIELYVHYDRPLSISERDILRSNVSRRGAGEPLQYITGEVGFRHITIKVRPDVLIPRPETEVLVSEALALLPADSPEQLLIADLCTGSGCIACSVAHEHSCSMVIATDISTSAVALARENVERLGLQDKVQVFEGDLGFAIPDDLGGFDLIVSNPPYIPSSELSEISEEVSSFEPILALDGGADGLDLFRRMLPWASENLKPDGALLVELHETCLDVASALATKAGFSQCRIIEDLTERPRILVAKK